MRALHVAVIAGPLILAGVSCGRGGGGKRPDFPTKAGTYTSGDWEYTCTIEHEGTRSEKRVGALRHGGSEVTGSVGEFKETPLGKFLWFESEWNRGWLNTLSGDRPVFADDGRPVKEVRYLLKPPAGLPVRPPRDR